MTVVGERIAKLSDSFYDRMRAPEAFTAARADATVSGFQALRSNKYCLLVSFRRSGEPVPTPLWFGLDPSGTVYVRTEANSGKVKRIRANPHVRVGPCNARGKPTGPLAAGTARVLPGEENERAEQALKANYGLGRRLYETVVSPAIGGEIAYLEVVSVPDRDGGGDTP